MAKKLSEKFAAKFARQIKKEGQAEDALKAQ